MSVETYDESRHHTIEWNAQLGAAVLVWEEYVTGEEFRASLNKLHEAIVEYGSQKFLVDTREIMAHDDEDKQWIAETWLPRLVEDGVRHTAAVYPDSAVADMDMEDIEEANNAVAEEYTFRAFTSEREAQAWLGQQ